MSGRWRGLGRRGVAAVEFALIVPVLLVLFVGTIEILTLYRTEAKLNALAFNVAQSVSITQAISATSAGAVTPGVTSLNDICHGAVLGLQPYPAAALTITIASVTEEAGPNGLPTSAPTHAATPTYDVWEGNFAQSGSGCAQTPSVTWTVPQAVALATANGGMILVPCDNVIIVRASLTYAGLTGMILPIRPTLTQTAYVRWPYASPTNELTCADCTLPSPATQICSEIDTSTN